MIRFACPHCQVAIKAPPQAAGRQVSCPKCKCKVVVPVPTGNMLPPVQPDPLDLDMGPEPTTPDFDFDNQPDSLNEERIGFRCPYCRSRRAPTKSKHLTAVGCILFVVTFSFMFWTCVIATLIDPRIGIVVGVFLVAVVYSIAHETRWDCSSCGIRIK